MGKHHQMECVSCFGSMEQQYRSIAINQFRKKQVNVMIVTELASRGLDIPLLDYVINYQMSTTPKAFVHRVGRVARNGKRGVAISIVEHEELAYVADIYRFLGDKLPTHQRGKEVGEVEQMIVEEDEDDNNQQQLEVDSDEEEETEDQTSSNVHIDA